MNVRSYFHKYLFMSKQIDYYNDNFMNEHFLNKDTVSWSNLNAEFVILFIADLNMILFLKVRMCP